MIKYKFLIVLIFILASITESFSQDINPNGYNKFTYPNGAISSEGYMKNGKPVGYWKSYYPDGKIKAEGTRKNEKLDSVWRFYNRMGFLTEIIDYKNDIKSGYHKKYKFVNDSDYVGNLMISKELYVEGEKNGKSYYYDERSRLRKTVEFEKNYKNGYERHYDNEGNIILIIKYAYDNVTGSEKINRRDKDGRKQGIWKSFFDNDKINTYSNFINDTLNGYFREYNIYGEIIRNEYYIMGKKEVISKEEKEEKKIVIKEEFYTDGNIKSKGSFIENKPVGIHRVYNKEGIVTDSKTYSENGVLLGEGIVDKDGKRKGDWIFFYESGEKKSEGKFENGRKVGMWNYYYKSGIIEQKGKYNNGRPEGLWFWYFENKKIRRSGKFANGREIGFFYELTEEGDTLSKGNYDFGLKTGEWTYVVNDDISRGEYISGKKEGVWKHYFNDGTLRYEGTFIEDFEDGRHRTFYPDGTVKQVAYYSMGNKDKKWKLYDKEGNLLTITEYRGGNKYKIDGQKVKDK